MIPRRIFYVWGAGEKKPRDVQVCIQTWRQVMPDYEIIEINQNDTRYFDFLENIKSSKFFKTMYENRLWAFMADYIRVRVLHDFGGIYFDTDVSVVRPLDKFLNDDAFVGMQDSEYTEPAVLGATQGNKFLQRVLDFYDTDFWKMPIYTIPQIFRHVLSRDYDINDFPTREKQQLIKTTDISIYPERVFIPFRCADDFQPQCIEQDTHTIHWFGGSWAKSAIMDWMKNKHINPDAPLDLSHNIINQTRFYIPLINIGLVKVIRYPHETVTRLMHAVTISRVTNSWFYLFGFIPVFRVR